VLVSSLEIRPASNPVRALKGEGRGGHRRGAVPGTRLPLVGDRETLSPFGAASLQDDSAVLRRHANPKSVRLLSAAGIGLICALSLHRRTLSSDPGIRSATH
jgi:hypothetical protein